MGSSNKVVVGNLIETFQDKDVKLYDVLKKTRSDLDKTFEALFDGPLPKVSAKNLDFTGADLSMLTVAQLPQAIAYKNLENIFIQNQFITKDDPLLTLTGIDAIISLIGVNSKVSLQGDNSIFEAEADGATKKTRLQVISDGKTLLGSGISWDGAAFQTDGGDNSGIILNADSAAFGVLLYIAGALAKSLRVNSTGQVTLGVLQTLTNLTVNELGLKNQKYIKGTNFAGDNNLPIVRIDAADLVVLGSNPAGFTTGEGNISIPDAVSADLPVAGASRNGILILDKGTNRLCYYVNGLRYKLALGTAF